MVNLHVGVGEGSEESISLELVEKGRLPERVYGPLERHEAADILLQGDHQGVCQLC